MIDLLFAAFSFPTIIFTVLMMIVLGYWCMVLLGAVDLDLLDSSGAEGIADAGGHDVHPHGEGSFATFLASFGMAGIPLTVSFTFLVLFGWFFSIVGTQWFGKPTLAMGAFVLMAATVLSIVGTSLAVRPLRRLFELTPALRRRQLVGRIGTLATQAVNAQYGQVEVNDDEGSTLLVQARAAEENGLVRGSRVMIYDYDEDREVFLVGPLGDQYTSFLDLKVKLPKLPRS